MSSVNYSGTYSTSINSNNIRNILRAKITNYFQLILMKSNLRLDLAASQGASHTFTLRLGFLSASACLMFIILLYALRIQRQPASQMSALAKLTRALERIVGLVTDILGGGGQLAFIAHASRSTGGPWFVAISLAHPLLSTYLATTFYDKGICAYEYFKSVLSNDPCITTSVCYGYVRNFTYQRIKSLEKFAAGALRQDIISGGCWRTGSHLVCINYYPIHSHD